MRFTWDARKAASNLQKHGIAFSEAVTVFADPLAIVIADDVLSERALLLGLSAVGRVLVTVYLEIHADETRIISARRATKHERRRYEEGQDD